MKNNFKLIVGIVLGAVFVPAATWALIALPVNQGGTGTSTLTTGYAVIGNGTSSVNLVAPSTSGNVLTSNGSSWISSAPTGGGNATTSLGSTIQTVTFISTPQTAQKWTDMPATETEIFNATSSVANINARQLIDLTRAEVYQISGRQAVAGTTGATLKLQCSADGTTWGDAGSSIGTIGVGVLAPQPRVGNLDTLNSACKGFVYLRFVGAGGNGAADPSWRTLKVDFYLTNPASGSTATSTVSESVASAPQTVQTWTSQPSGLAEMFGTNLTTATNQRFNRNTTNATHVRLIVNQSVAGLSTARLYLQCSSDNTTFASSSASNAEVLDIGLGTGIKFGALSALDPACIGSNKYFRLVGLGGNGATAGGDPGFGQIKVDFTYTESALGGSNWSFDTNFNQPVLTTSSTIPVWLKAAIYASSTLTVQSDNFATTTIGDTNTFLTIGRTILDGSFAADLKIPTIFGDTLSSSIGALRTVGINNNLLILEDRSLNLSPSIDFGAWDFGSTVNGGTLKYVTSTPAFNFNHNLEIQSTDNDQPTLNFISDDTSTSSAIFLTADDSMFFTGASNSYYFDNAIALLDDDGNNMVFGSTDGSVISAISFSTSTDQMQFLQASGGYYFANGNVGIGNSSPGSKLTIEEGDVYISSSTRGIIQKSPDGACWRMSVSNLGVGTWVSITCP